MNNSIFRLLAFYMRYSRGTVVLAACVGLLAGGSSAALMALITTKITYSGGFASPWYFAGLALLVLLATTASGFISTHLANRTGYDMRLYLSRKLLDSPLRYVEEAGTHRVLAALTEDIPKIAGGLLKVPGLCTSLAILVGGLIFLAVLSPAMLLTVVFFIAVAVSSYVVPQARANRILARAREDWDALVDHFRTLSEGGKELKLNRRRRETFFTEMIQSAAMSFRRHNSRGQYVYVLLNSWSQILYFVVTGVVIFVLPFWLGNISTRVLTGYVLTILYLGAPIAALVSIFPIFGMASVSLHKLEQLGWPIDELGAEPETVGADAAEPLRGRRTLELEGVTHSYRREGEDGNFTLGPIDLTVRAGELIFLVGGNGSGKTTLAKLLCGLYVPESGRILLDGQPVVDENRDAYRQNFSVVFSDFHLFERLLGAEDPAVHARAEQYLTQLQLAHKVQLREGKLSTLELSQGQRKRLALLTEYIEDRPVYVFDEWAADQDPLFKDIFYYQILPELTARGKTVIAISHDDRYYRVADRIVKLDYGKVVSDEPADCSEEARRSARLPLPEMPTPNENTPSAMLTAEAT